MSGYNITSEGRYKVEVIADSSGEWCGNGMRFATVEEATAYGTNLAWRWTLVREFRVVDTNPGLRDGNGVPWKDKPEDDDIEF